MRALGATTTRCPARCARHERSRSSRNCPNAGSKPPSASKTSRRMSIPEVLTPRTSVRSSCWPWSGSPLAGPPVRTPERVTCCPTSSRRDGSSQVISLGPATPTDGDLRAASSRWARASGAAALSSWSSQSHSPGQVAPVSGAWEEPGPMDNCSTARPTASPKVLSRVAEIVTTSPITWRIRPCVAAIWRLSSVEPVSTMISRSGGRVWSSSASRHSFSHAAPSWTTSTPVTTTGRRAARATPGSRGGEGSLLMACGGAIVIRSGTVQCSHRSD